MSDMRGWLGLLVVVIIAGVCSGQSTTSRPQAQCASYLNRYTQENQCIYSFIVPKKDSDHCPGLEDQIRSLQAIVQEIQVRQNRTDEQIRNINKNEENLRRIGRLEAEIAKLTQEKAARKDEYEDLLALSKEHETEKARLTIQLTNAEDALRGARGRLVPLERNHTALEGDFIRVRDDLANLRAEHNNLKMAFAALHKTKNCSDVNKHLPSCAVIKEWGYTRSGDAMIDPDGEGGVEPFLVYCDMDSDPSTGITVVKNDHAEDSPVSGCEESGCFTQSIKYRGATVEQISTLVDISLACEQGIKYRCYDSKLLRDDTGWWVSRNGSKQTYWGGAPPGSNKCACGVTGTCFDRTEVCNCDADAEQWLQDEGMLLDKDSLPVTALRFGDVSPRSNEKGNYTLGPLRCKWNVNQSVPSCNALQQAGVTRSGTFLVDPDGSKGPQMALLTHCNLETGSNSSVGSVGPRGDPNMYVFSDCGKEPGRFGPDQDACNKSYFGGNVYVRVVEGIQMWRVPRDGRYRITAYAPSGHHSTPALAGRGAIANAEFKLPEGTQMKVLVGQQGLRTSGSGGTFVIRVEKTYTDIPYVIAGAGGSSTGSTAAYSATDASVTADGKNALRWAANIGNGGIDGNGGDRGNRLSGENTPGGGAGFKTDGTASGDQRFGKPEAAKAVKGSGKGKLAPGVGGSYSYLSTKYDGGFGGGGSGTKNGPGGAGGYSGGGGGSSDGHSGGGGSYVHSDAINRNLEAANRGRGRVTIEYLGPAPELSA